MSQELVLEIFRGSLKMGMLIMSPLLLAAMIVGLLVSIVQSATQIHEVTLTFVPKILAVVLVLVLLFPWMLNNIVTYTVTLFSNFSTYVR
ncbi:MAG TPA: flagellar biosynthesis protein FliQ [Syntrophorhabdales bacterium]|nr:flagellar biosynthesis protein FliQ [Syntrophorhabdales bacterium]